jgi:hypothetical protein
VLDEFFEKIKEAETELNTDVYWYRGHSQTSYKLTPTLFRLTDEVNESEVFYDYKMYSSSLNKATKSNWDILFDMQHFGLPTRLLDWTSSIGAALFFALKDTPESPCIWICSPYDICDSSTGKYAIYDASTIGDSPAPHSINLGVHHLITNKSNIVTPFPVIGAHGNVRITAQRGMFTVHGSSKEPLEVLCPSAIKRVDIPLALVDKLKSYLDRLGIDDFSMFPDQYGLADFLKKKYKM